MFWSFINLEFVFDYNFIFLVFLLTSRWWRKTFVKILLFIKTLAKTSFSECHNFTVIIIVFVYSKTEITFGPRILTPFNYTKMKQNYVYEIQNTPNVISRVETTLCRRVLPFAVRSSRLLSHSSLFFITIKALCHKRVRQNAAYLVECVCVCASWQIESSFDNLPDEKTFVPATFCVCVDTRHLPLSFWSIKTFQPI